MSEKFKEDGVNIDHIPHEDCGSSDALAVYQHEDGSIDGFCWACETYVANPYGVEGKAPEQKEDFTSYEAVADVGRYPIKALTGRGISLDAATKYGVRVSIDPMTGEPDAHYYPVYKKGQLTGYKKRILATKQFPAIGDTKKSELFGQNVCGNGGKFLIIVEGELDTLAAYDMFRQKGKKYRVVGLNTGANTRGVLNNIEWLEKFETIVLALDQDEAGQRATKDISKVLGAGKVKTATFSEKDPNDMLVNGKIEEFFSAVMNAKEYTPEGFVQISDIFEEATKMPEYGRPYPWPELTRLTYGRRDGEGIYVGAGVKMGKSEWVNQMLQHIIEVEGRPAAVFKFEEQPAMTARRVAGKLKHKQFHKPDGDFTQEELIQGVKELDGKLIMFDTYHRESGNTWDIIKPAIRHAALVDGVKDFFFDPITNFTDGMSPGETDTELRRISNELAAMSKDLGFFYYCFCHLKAPVTGKPHEEGGRVHSNQFRGSRAMMEKTYYMLGIERDKSPELPIEERNMSTFVLLEDRAFGQTGRFEVFYNDTTGDYLEPDRNKEEF